MSRKGRHWATQQKAEVNKQELGNQLGRSWENLLLEYFEDVMRAASSALPLMANPFFHTAGQLMFTLSFSGAALEALTSHNKLKLGGKSLLLYQMLVQLYQDMPLLIPSKENFDKESYRRLEIRQQRVESKP